MDNNAFFELEKIMAEAKRKQNSPLKPIYETYKELVVLGFSEDQAFKLVNTIVSESIRGMNKC